jgi:hypothetical protein
MDGWMVGAKLRTLSLTYPKTNFPFIPSILQSVGIGFRVDKSTMEKRTSYSRHYSYVGAKVIEGHLEGNKARASSSIADHHFMLPFMCFAWTPYLGLTISLL